MNKTIVFVYNYGIGKHNKLEKVKFDMNATEDEIREAFKEWVWQIVRDKVTWYEKD